MFPKRIIYVLGQSIRAAFISKNAPSRPRNLWLSSLLLVFLFLIPYVRAFAAQVTLAWDPNGESDLAGYKIYYGTTSHNYTFYTDVGDNESVTISDLDEGSTYYFAVTAYDNQQNESDFSNEVAHHIVNVGSSNFGDVPPGYWAEDYIYAFLDAGITVGCSQIPFMYCPENLVTRAEMAVFLERALNGGDFTPPSATGTFDDVDDNHWAAAWIEQFYADGITVGCSQVPFWYCPENQVTRAEMAVFLLRSKHGSDYQPPSAGGIFGDVPTSHWAADWIEQLYREGITVGCSQTPFLYCPENRVTRAEMAVFIVRTFDL